MRFFAFLLLVVLIVAVVDARGRRKTTRRPPPPPPPPCKGLPNVQVCTGGRDEGRSGRGCDAQANHNMWHYNEGSRTCVEMRYLGCGGNGNRHCTRHDCEQRCRR